MQEHRVMIVSDIHNCHAAWYRMTNGERMADLIHCLEEAKAARDYELTLCLGDVSLDFWAFNEGGSYLWDPPVSRTAEFIEQVMPAFPQPFYITPGNHEQYAPEDWLRITRQPREQIVRTDWAVFVLLDAFSGDLGPTENSDGTYFPVNVSLIREALALPGGRPVFLLAHWFDMERESGEFRAVLCENPRIRALFCGHDHRSFSGSTGPDAGDLPILHDGHFSYSGEHDPYACWRGWRELIVREDGSWESFYRVPHQAVPYPAWSVHIDAHIQDEIQGTSSF
ncbi:MAG: metallophosphoesterase [Clostridiales bacterium]|nr:metallophosphoesterase [Clostridiales bacterium]